MRDRSSDDGLPRLVSAKDVVRACGISRTTLWRMIRDKQFPPAVAISPNRVGWRESDVKDWIDRRFGQQLCEE